MSGVVGEETSGVEELGTCGRRLLRSETGDELPEGLYIGVSGFNKGGRSTDKLFLCRFSGILDSFYEIVTEVRR